jgi:hypothetical protein
MNICTGMCFQCPETTEYILKLLPIKRRLRKYLTNQKGTASKNINLYSGTVTVLCASLPWYGMLTIKKQLQTTTYNVQKSQYSR